MERALVIRGNLSDPRHIELDEPILELHGPVEVVVRPLPSARSDGGRHFLQLIAVLPPGTRTKEDIDRQIRQERDAWGDR